MNLSCNSHWRWCSRPGGFPKIANSSLIISRPFRECQLNEGVIMQSEAMALMRRRVVISSTIGSALEWFSRCSGFSPVSSANCSSLQFVAIGRLGD